MGGGSNAIGIFYDFIKDKKVKLIGVEAGGRGEELGEHAARFRGGSPGVLQGTYSYVLQDERRTDRNHALGLGRARLPVDWAGARLAERHGTRRVCSRLRRGSARGDCTLLARTEGIIPALESAHAVAEAIKRAPKMKKSEILLVNISGRGDKDIGIMRENLKLVTKTRNGIELRNYQITQLQILDALSLRQKAGTGRLRHVAAIPISRPRARSCSQRFVRAPTVIELGVPFSDPVADGPVIQRASERALKHGTSLDQVLKLAAEIREQSQSVGLIIFTYLNPILRMGVDKFCKIARHRRRGRRAGHRSSGRRSGRVSRRDAQANDLAPIFLAAPTSTDERLKRIAQASSGFVYAVSRTGRDRCAQANVRRRADAGEAAAQIHEAAHRGRLRNFYARAVCGGWAATPTRAVVGSAIVEPIEQNPGKEAQSCGRICEAAVSR